MMHKLDVLALLTRIASLGALAADATFQAGINALAGPYATKILAGIGLAGVVAADIIRFQANPSVTTAEATPVLPATATPEAQA